MISFIQLPYRRADLTEDRREIRPGLVALSLALILCFQIALVIWVYLKDWTR